MSHVEFLTRILLLLKRCDVLDNAVYFKRLLDVISMALYYCFKLLRLFCIYKRNIGYVTSVRQYVISGTGYFLKANCIHLCRRN
jgi:hypothetical protein